MTDESFAAARQAALQAGQWQQARLIFESVSEERENLDVARSEAAAYASGTMLSEKRQGQTSL